MAYERGGNSWLLRFIESPHFTLFRCVSYLEQYAGNVGIHFHLCQKLRSYPQEEIEFFLPQLVQLQVTVETESMALEDLLLELCNESTHCTLLVFWQLQAHLTELAGEPDSYGFQICKRLYNKMQYILFNVGNPPVHGIRENTQPALILSSAIAAGVGLPQLGTFIKPLALSQGRKQRSHIFHLASKLLRSKSTSTIRRNNSHSNNYSTSGSKMGLLSQDPAAASSTPDLGHTDNHPDFTTTSTSRKSSSIHASRVRSIDGAYDSQSMPDVSASAVIASSRSSSGSARHSPTPSISSTISASSSRQVSSSGSAMRQRMNLDIMTNEEKIKALKTNYFRCETQFVYALQAISSRLLQVPKKARLSALRVELAMLNRDLPAELDIPMLIPTEGRQNRIVRISPAEATVLNSAERVPFLLLIEYIKDDVDFDPETDVNKELLMQDESKRRYIFDLAYLHNRQAGSHRSGEYSEGEEDDMGSKPVEEKDLGDVAINYDRTEMYAHDALSASVQSINTPTTNSTTTASSTTTAAAAARAATAAARAKAVDGANRVASPRSLDLSFSSSYRPSTPVQLQSPNQPHVDVTDIATHMRTAAIMLTQLDAGGSKLSKAEIENIKNKIIASMQSMEENTIYGAGAATTTPIQGEAGERKLENDMKTAGMSSSSNDDPSAANLGEDWNMRKERIRRSSPFGHLPGWDLCSVIAKTGNDLRQEAFACQLIQAMQRIWLDNNVEVWVKKMRILITNDSSGLVETITNGLSVHSIKKALTTASLKSGQNPKGTISSLTDHFEQKFGSPDSDRYMEAQDAFVKSLAAYSMICYILQIKDRHNGNILLDSEGHIIHIDFGFLLSNSPGRVGFEAAPFKLTQEYVELMGGVESPMFDQFRRLLKQSFKVLRKNAESIIILVEMMARDSNLPCFYSGAGTSLQLRQRFQLHMSDSEVDTFVDNVLIQKSIGSIYTRLYDQYQLLTQGIYS